MKKKAALGILCLLLTHNIYAQNSTDIWVYSMKEKKGRITLSKGERITNRDAYDNQPTFFRSDFLLYTSQIGDQTDIIVHNLYEGENLNITNSPESEYSAQVIGNYDTFGAVRVEPDGRQRIWLFHLDGKSKPEVVMEKVEPVGYFAWNSINDVLAFVLGDPITLVKGNVNQVDDFIVTSHVGRTIKVIPGTNDFAFERVEENGEVNIYRLNDTTDEFEVVIKKPEGALDWCITNEGTYITSIGTKLYGYNPEFNIDWKVLTELGDVADKGITRMAVNQDNKRIAIVMNN